MTAGCCDHVGKTQPTIDTLSDDALLYVFNFYVAQASEVEVWHTLVHVCRRWRNIVFGSPRHLNLRILCTNKTPVREKLDIWPPVPIVISANRSPTNAGLHNIKAALEHHDRVCQIKLSFVLLDREKEDLVAPLEEPFPILTDLHLDTLGASWPFDPDPSKFLGGSAHLRSLTLRGFQIPGLQKILLCALDLVILHIDVHVRRCPYLPNEVVTVLSALTRLEQLQIEFGQCPSDLENRRLPLLTRTVLPSLTVLKVTADTKNMEDFMARIDAPLLDQLCILFSCYYHDVWDVVLDTQQLLWFISRIPKLQAPSEANIGFATIESATERFNVWIEFLWPTQISSVVKLGIHCRQPKWEVPSLAQFCRSPFFPLPTLEHLYIGRGQSSLQPHRDNTRWLELLQPFTAVKNLYLTKELAPCIAPALRELVIYRATEVLPTLQNIFIEDSELRLLDPVHEAIALYAAARKLSGHSIVISHWDGT